MRAGGRKDVFNSYLVSRAYYEGGLEFPVIQPTDSVPGRLVAFSKAILSKDHDQWVHFFEYDYQFERVWRSPRRYLPIFKRFQGVILPDFSLYRDVPLCMQTWNIYRSRAIGTWLQDNGVDVIVNMRFGDERTFPLCCDGAPHGCVIAVGTNGAIDDEADRSFMRDGIDWIVGELAPTTIVVYGSAPEDIFVRHSKAGIRIVAFESDASIAHKGGK